MIDMWFLFSLLKPFVDIIAQTYIETLRESSEKMGKEKIAWNDKDILVIDNGLSSKSSVEFYNNSLNFRATNGSKAGLKSAGNRTKIEKKIAICKFFLRVIYPGLSIAFIILFIIIGLAHQINN